MAKGNFILFSVYLEDTINDIAGELLKFLRPGELSELIIELRTPDADKPNIYRG